MPLIGLFIITMLFNISVVLANEEIDLTGKSTLGTKFRFENSLSGLRLSPQNRYLAYIEKHPINGELLKVFEFGKSQIFEVSNKYVGASFCWAPHGVRLFFREQESLKGMKKVTSFIKAYDMKVHKNLTIAEIQGPTGFLNLDPLDLQMRTLTSSGLLTYQLRYPGSRLAKWQKKRNLANGHWLVSQNGVLWLSQNSGKMSRMIDDKSSIESFSLSPDGRLLAWTTKNGNLYISDSNKKVLKVGKGRHPSWHQEKRMLVYSRPRVIGIAVVGYDLAVTDLLANKRWLNNTPHSDEEWPVFYGNNDSILFTVANTSDLFIKEFKSGNIASSNSTPVR